METQQIVVGVTFAIYIVAMLGIGVYAYFKTKNLDDYLIGGRNMNFFVTALSACASDMSGWLIMGLPGAVFLGGLSEIWIGIALLLGIILNWQFVAKPLRVQSEELEAITISEYFEKRFKDKTRLLRLITAIVILVFFFIYTISGLVAGGKLFNSVFNVDYTTAVVISGMAVVIYTSVGGFIAVSWTDMVQGLLMLIALVAVPIFAIAGLDDSVSFVQALEAKNNALSFFTNMKGEAITTIALISTFGWGLGYFGMPHILTRFMAIDSVDNIKKAKRTAIIWSAFSLGAAILVGLSGIVAIQGDLTNFDSERVFINLIQMFFHPIPASICLAAILAAIMSTADSQLLVCTSVITEDIYRTFFKRDATEKELVNIGRVAVVVIAALAMIFALDDKSQVMKLVSYAWAGFGAAFGPAILFSLYWKKMTGWGAFAGIVIGAVTVVVWKNISGGIFDMYEIIPAFIFSSIAICLVSRMTQKSLKEA